MTAKDILYVFEGSELSNGFPGVAHHVVDDLWLNGVTLLAYFQLCLVLEVKNRTHKHDDQPHYEAQFLNFPYELQQHLFLNQNKAYHLI